MNELSQAPKDTSRSCIFDFPDRPDRPDSPVDGNGPYDPRDDWPVTPADPPVPGIDPIPGSDPHPYPASPFPPTSPTITFNDQITYETTPGNPGDLFFTNPPTGYLGTNPNYYKNATITPDVGAVIASIMFANKNAAHTLAGAALLAEQGLAVVESGVYLTYCNVGAVWFVYICYYARNGSHFAVEAAPISGIDNPPNSVVGVANLTVSSWYLGGTITPKSFATGAIYLVDGTIPLNLSIG